MHNTNALILYEELKGRTKKNRSKTLWRGNKVLLTGMNTNGISHINLTFILLKY